MREVYFCSFLIVFYLLFLLQLSSSTVVLEPYSISFPDLPAKSALGIKSSGVCGSLHMADPPNACSSLLNFTEPNGTGEIIDFVLIIRGQCSFEDKIRNAQNSGFRAAIVYDDKIESNLVYMMINPEGVKVHAVFVSNAAGEVLRSFAREGPGECCIYPSHVGKAWTVLAISLISLAVMLACLIAAFFAPRRWVSGFRVVQTGFYRRNVDARTVGALPNVVFRSSRDGTGGETCAICLEDYKDGEILRLLPCQHEFHSSCVDLWLTKWGTSCPVCKLDLKTNTAVLENKRGIWLQNQQRT